MTERAQPTDLELAALISSKICHDVIGPVGAIYNGLEILDEDDDAEAKNYALDVIATSPSRLPRGCAVRPLCLRRGRVGGGPDRARHRRADQPRAGRPGQTQARVARCPGSDGQGQGEAAPRPDRQRSHGPAARRRDRGDHRRQPGEAQLPAALPRHRRPPAPVPRRLCRRRRSRRSSMPCRSRPITRGGLPPRRGCAWRSPRTGPTSS